MSLSKTPELPGWTVTYRPCEHSDGVDYLDSGAEACVMCGETVRYADDR